MNFNTQSIMKAAGAGAAVNAIIAVISAVATYFVIAAPIGWLLLCCGGILIPVATGALYGYFTPGKEELGQSAAGGAVSGLVAGVAFGIINALLTAILGLVNGAAFADVVAGSSVTFIMSCCGAVIFGAILGAIGGAVWTFVQGDK